MDRIGSVGRVLAGNMRRTAVTATTNSQNTDTTDWHGNNTDKINSAFDLIRVVSVSIRGLRVLAVSDPQHRQEPASAPKALSPF
jgi:hypothetical protein